MPSRFWRPCRASAAGRFALVVILALATAALESAALVALPFVLKAGGVGDHATLPRALGGLGLPVMLAIYVGLVALTAGLVYLQTMETTRLVLDYGEDIRWRLHRAVMSAGWGTPALARPADLVHALTAEAGQCAQAVRIAIGATTRLLALPPLLTAAVLLSPGFTLAAILLAAVASLPMLPLNKKAYRMAGAMARAARAVNAEITDQMAGCGCSRSCARRRSARRNSVAASPAPARFSSRRPARPPLSWAGSASWSRRPRRRAATTAWWCCVSTPAR